MKRKRQQKTQLSTFGSSLSSFIGLYFGYCLLHFKSHASRLLHWIPLSILMLLAGIGLNFVVPINKNLYSISYILFMAGFAGIALSCFYLVLDVPGSAAAAAEAEAASAKKEGTSRDNNDSGDNNSIKVATSAKLLLAYRWFTRNILFLPLIALGMNSIAVFVADPMTSMFLGSRGDTGFIYWKEPSQNIGNWLWGTVFLADNYLPVQAAILLYSLLDVTWWTFVAIVLFKLEIFFKV